MTLSHSAKGSASSRGGESIDDGMRSLNTYDDNGYLPIHRAVSNGYEVTLKNILDDAQKRNELNQQLEAKTERTELTPLLLAVAVGRLPIISFLLKYSVNINAVDANGNGIIAIAALSQNERTLRYMIEVLLAEHSYNVWKPLLKLYTSLSEDESSVGGRVLEILTRPKADTKEASSYWPPIIDNGLIPALVHTFTESKNEDTLISTYLILLNAIDEQPRIHNELIPNKKAFGAMLKHTCSKNTEIVTLLGRLLASLTRTKSLAKSIIDQGLFEAAMTLIEKERTPEIISSYFDCLANVVSYSSVYQVQIANYPLFLPLLINHYLEEFDLDLSLAVMRFVRQLVSKNEEIQNLLAQNDACEHILGALTASSKDLQQMAIETIQEFADNNPHVQYIMIRENAFEQLLNLLDKTNVASLQIAIVRTLWTLCGIHSSRKRDVATRIGVKKLISYYNLKSDEHLLALTDILGELTKRSTSIKINVAEEINRAVGIPPILRLLTSDNEALVISALREIQLLTCAPGFISNTLNQETIVKYDGIRFLVALMMHVKNEDIQVEAAQALACITLANNHCLTVIETTLDFSFTCLFTLMESTNPIVQLKASNALATFIYNNRQLEEFLAQHYRFSFDYFQKFLEHNNNHIRCAAAFQVVVLANLIPEQSQAINTAIGCGVLMDVLRMSSTDEEKSNAAECLARLSHIKSSVPHALIAANGIDYLCDLFSSKNDTTIGVASIALGYLSYIHEGERQLLHRCRGELDIMAFLKVYNCLPGQPPRLSKHLLEAWDRYSALKLPKLRSRGSNVRYYKVLANNIERLRVPSSSTSAKESNRSSPVKFYLPSIRSKVH